MLCVLESGDSKYRPQNKKIAGENALRRMPSNSDKVDPVDRYIGRLYRSGLQVPAEHFRSWALRELNKIIPHDAAVWGSGSFAQYRFHTVTVTGLDASFPERLEATHAINPVVPDLISKPDTPIDWRQMMPDRKFYASEIYRQAFEPYGIQRILVTTHLDRRSGMYSLISLYRFDRKHIFTEQDTARQQRIAYHLCNAASHAFFLRMLRTSDRPAGSAAAVVDKLGCFHEAQPQFLDLLEEHFPERELHTLPFALPSAGETTVVGDLCVRAEPAADMFTVYLWRCGPLDRLTPREREIVLAVAQGLSFKQAAKKIGLAPSTVANHLYRVYRKLGVYSRTELAGLVHPQDKD